MHRSFLLIVVYFTLLPTSRAGYNNEEIPLAVISFFMAGYWFESNDNQFLTPVSFQTDSVIEYPYSNGTKRSGYSDSGNNQSQEVIPSGCRAFSIKLEKLLINIGTPEKGPIYCHICSRNFATGHLPCCQQLVCRECRKKSDGSSCPLCRCRICLGSAEESVESSCCQNFFCKSCLDRWTLETNICPDCKSKICDEPGKKKLSQHCKTCNMWVARNKYSGHLQSEHRESKTHILDYTFCNICTLYIHPAIWTEHSREPGHQETRTAPTRALSHIQSMSPPAEDDRNDNSDNDDPDLIETECLSIEDSCSSGDQNFLEEMEVGQSPPATTEQTLCPICSMLVCENQMSDHMAQPDHGTCHVRTLWHVYCHNRRIYIRSDLYYFEFN